MFKKRLWMAKALTFLLAVSPLLAEGRWCLGLIGEPEIPLHYKK